MINHNKIKAPDGYEETSPVTDRQFGVFTSVVEECSAKQSTGCMLCPVKYKCLVIFNRAVNLSLSKKLTRDKLNTLTSEFFALTSRKTDNPDNCLKYAPDNAGVKGNGKKRPEYAKAAVKK
jgi:hypothetical protein